MSILLARYQDFYFGIHLSFYSPKKLPRLYDNLSYFKIIELKEMINVILANDKPQDNKIFDENGVKSKMILLNYLLDMEDVNPF